MSRALTALAALGAAGLVAGGALGATLGVSSERLTMHSSATSIDSTPCTLASADADAYVSEALPVLNFGNELSLDVRSFAALNARTFVKFDLSGCAIPANAQVTSATLELTMFTAPTASETYDAHRVTSAWTETGVTWLSQPTLQAVETASVATGTIADITLSFDVTADVQAFVDGVANQGWCVRDRTEGSLVDLIAQFRSSEFAVASFHPRLSISYYP